MSNNKVHVEEENKPRSSVRRCSSFKTKEKYDDINLMPCLKRGHSLESIEQERNIGSIISSPRNSSEFTSSGKIKLKEIRRKISRSTSREKISSTTKFCFADNSLYDPRITDKISLFYLLQQLPSDFPSEILENLYSRFNSVSEVQKLLARRGWELKIPQANNNEQSTKTCPCYYFGAWSYDCWSIFEGAPNGSFITCHKENRYYVVYKSFKKGKIVLRSMRSGPELSSSLQRKFPISKALVRPPFRYICQKCCQNTPCLLPVPEKEFHKSELSKFTVSYPVMIKA